MERAKKDLPAFPREKAELLDYLGMQGREDAGQIAEGVIRVLQKSRAMLCVIPAWDWLGLGQEARINQPGTSEGNWTWRARPDAFTPGLAERIRAVCESCSRV